MADELKWEFIEEIGDRAFWSVCLPLTSDQAATAWLSMASMGKATLQLAVTSEGALDTGVVTLHRGNNRARKGYVLESTITMNAEAMTAAIPVDSFGYLRAVVSTVDADVEVELTACLVKREFS